MIKVKKGKAKGSKELRDLYTEAINSKEEYSYLAPGSYNEQELIILCQEENKLFRPIAKSFKLV